MKSLPTIDESIAFIKQPDVHGATEYKLGVPYYQHPINVMNRLKDHMPRNKRTNVPEDVPIELQHAALLHDVIEDTGYDRDSLLGRGYSEKVLDIVAAVTNVKPAMKLATDVEFIAWYRDQIQQIADGTKVIGNYADGHEKLLKDDPETHLAAIVLKKSDKAENMAPENLVDIAPDKLDWFNRKYAGTDQILSDGLRALEAARGQGSTRCA